MLRRFWCALLCLLALGTAALAGQRISLVSGNCQSGVDGFPLKEDFVVRVTSGDGLPLAGCPVAFTVIPPDPAARHAAELSSPIVLTDAEGYARTRLTLPAATVAALTVMATTADTIDAPLLFRVTAHSRFWILVMISGILGGLGLFLFGMFQMNNALQKIAGPKFRSLLMTFTRSPVRGLWSGLFLTLFNQSSSATTLLEVSLVSAGLLTFQQTMAVTMGAEIGSTITGQLIAFRLAEYAVVIAGLGFFLSLVSPGKQGKHIGTAVVGFGLLFLGMKIMADLMLPIRNFTPFLDLMRQVNNPLVGIGIGLGITLVIHSSGATIGIVIALALAGAIDLYQAVIINLGAQIGTCLTAWLGAIGRGTEGKRVALWHVTHQTLGVVLVLPLLLWVRIDGQPVWLAAVAWLTKAVFFTEDLARQIAMAHTMAAVLNALVFLPLLPLLGRALCALYPAREEVKPFGPVYIDEGLLSAPVLALGQARKEIVREGEIVLEMMRESLEVFGAQDLKLSETVSLKDVRADVLRNAVVPYLTRIGQGTLTEEQSRCEIQLLYIAADLEAIGDVIDKNIMPLARKKLENKLWFSDEGWNDIVALHGRVADNLQKAVTAIGENNHELARLLVAAKNEINGYESELRKRHIARLHAGLQESLETSSVHLDLIDQYKRINSHVATIGATLLGQI